MPQQGECMIQKSTPEKEPTTENPEMDLQSGNS